MAVVCGEMLSEVIRRALRCYVEQGYERTVGARHDGWFVQNRRCHYQLGLDIGPRPVRDMASSNFRRPRARRLIQGVTAVNPAHSLPSNAITPPAGLCSAPCRAGSDLVLQPHSYALTASPQGKLPR